MGESAMSGGGDRAVRRPLARPGLFRVAAVALAAVLGATLLPGNSTAQETDAEKAAREIQEARDRANAAADAFFRATSDLELLEEELEGLQIEEAQLQATVDQLRSEVEGVAIARFVSSGANGIPLLTDVTDPQDQVQAEVYVDVLTNTGADTLDQYDAAEKALRETQREVAERQDEVEAQQALFTRLQEEANEEVRRLRKIEEERLQDEAVQKALEAQIARERAALEEQARLEAEAAARAQPNPGLVVPTTTEPPAPTGTDQVDDGSTADDAGDGATDGDDSTDGDGDGSDEPGASTTLPPASTLPPDSGGSGGTSGGRTGGGGAGSAPGGIATNGVYIDNIICPMPGSAYGDTWGAPRSGGRRHQGVDMLAPTGVPMYAVVSGYATFKQNRLGGNAVSLVGDNGNRYYYAHLSRYEGVSRRVEQGEVIGYNGDTGNARGTPHLHFQVHPGGGQPVNPTPTVRAAGC